MSNHNFTLASTPLTATPTGALWMAGPKTLCVSDLHLGKSGRIARRTGTMLPPFDTTDTLLRLGQDIASYQPETVICLGDSFDDLTASTELSDDARTMLATLQSGRDWIWVEGNHDPAPTGLGGTALQAFAHANLTFRHIATSAKAEVSGHYHPKFGIKGLGPARACFLYDRDRIILPAYGTFTGGLSAQSPVLRALFPTGAIAVLTGKTALPVPVRN